MPTEAIRGGVSVTHRKNKDKSLTFYLVWHEVQGDGRIKQRRARVCRSEPDPDRASKRAWAHKASLRAEEHLDYLMGRIDPPNIRREFVPVAINHAVRRYLEEEEARGLGFSSIDNKDRTLTEFVNFLGRTSPSTRCVHQVSARHVNGQPENGYEGFGPWRTSRGIQTSTLQLDLWIIQAFLRWCWKKRMIRKRTKIRIPQQEPVVRPLILDSVLVRRIVESQPDPVRVAALRTLACTGMRPAELRSLRVDSWDSLTRVLTIPKTGVQRTKIHHRKLPLGPKLAEAMDYVACLSLDPAGPLFTWNGKPLLRHVNHWMTPFNGSPKDLRCWMQYQLEKAKCPAGWIDDLMGHVPAGMRAHYTPGCGEDYRRYMVLVEEALESAEGV